MTDARTLLDAIADPPREFRPVSFWFLNHFLEPDELRRQIREHDEKGFGGVMCHARDGLRTAYLEREWEDALRVVADECGRRGMQVWLYDENHYPSGIAGGKIPRRFPGRTMMSLVPILDTEAAAGGRVSADLPEPPAYLLAAPAESGGAPADLRGSVRNGRLEWTNTLGEPARVLALVERGYRPAPGNHPDFSRYPDYLDGEVCRAFIEETHEWYAARFGGLFGTVIRGIFTDNACAHFGHIRRCVPWSRDLGARFAAATGVPVESVLPKLLHPLPGYREARLRFWRFFGDEFIRTFVGAINRWCRERRLHSTGHYCLEDGMGEHVRQIGSYFDVMRNQTLNAVDQIHADEGRSLWGIGGEPLTACIRNTASAALFNDSPRVMCESFGCCTGWGFNLRELRRIGDHLAALGVDFFVPHGVYYSIAGSRKYECIPDHLHHPMWAYYREWSDHASRLSMLAAGSDSLAETAVLHPVTTLQAVVALGSDEGPELFASAAGIARGDDPPAADRGADAARVRGLCDGLLDGLSRRCVGYEVLSEDVLQRGRPEPGGALAVAARGGRSLCRFRAVVLPGVGVLEAASLAVLEAFAEKGGTVVCAGAVPAEVYDPAAGLLSPLPAPFLAGKFVPLGIGAAPDAAVAAVCAFLRARSPGPVSVEGGDGALVARAWAKDGCRFHLLHNGTDRRVAGVRLGLRDAEEPVELDLDAPRWRRFPWRRKDGVWTSDLELAPAGTVLFVCGIRADDAEPSGRPTAPSARSFAIDSPWTFSADRENVAVLRRGRVEQQRSVQRHTYAFTVDAVPARCRVLIDLEMTMPELLAGRHSGRLAVELNGVRLTDFRPGEYLDRFIREAGAGGALREGPNELVVAVDASLREQGHRLWPPMLVGDFGVVREEDGERIVAPPRTLRLGDWSPQGFPDFAGEGRYAAAAALPADAVGGRLRLDLGDLADAVEVRVDGIRVGRRVGPPWVFDLPASPRAVRELEVRVVNSPNNLFELHPRPAGLFGPVRVLW